MAWGKIGAAALACLIGLATAPAAQTAIDVELVVEGLERPLFVGHAGDDSGGNSHAATVAARTSWGPRQHLKSSSSRSPRGVRRREARAGRGAAGGWTPDGV